MNDVSALHSPMGGSGAHRNFTFFFDDNFDKLNER